MHIPLSRPDITEEEIKEVLEALKSPFLSMGPKTDEFERMISEYAGRKYAVAVNSGTSALHLIIKSLGIGKGDEVITTPFSFVASANCILYEGAVPVFCDIDRESFNIDVSKIEEKITSKTKAILAVDIFGNPADWIALKKIAEKHNLILIEDSAESLGSEFEGSKCGSFGKASVFAFFPNKQITTGEGGVILTDDIDMAETCYSLRNQGRRFKNGKWLEHVILGYNYRMTEMSAALGIAQIRRIGEILKKRNKVANLYNSKLKGICKLFNNKGSWFVYVVELPERNKVMSFLLKEGISCSNYFYPIHLQPFYKRMFGYKEGDFPIAEEVSSKTLALPFYNDLQEGEINFIVEKLKKIA
ncbi:MAG: polysaccharide biosynthesis protein [Candidatus Nealsonbacteria bacterium RIFOXYB1_FULL_40_15]|uniref:Polysaccharide biosynthesis protein n=2 Tax=Candidatus Nealsoniibacteriota TaxID=1817911 RepID=A0A1G2ESE9_9BACT|nr:MAG: polysaccharide biosynthesis protein [Candidatus Nealsonbacteria bacterium RIFOXYB1_FULL_40_15]OGZ28178.1 MAG: polysaccharide biosynthesis protein [Candidatus Nealsonbacteria bacterium RIFOXYC1_FULL_40_7]OGZ29020.1 MAG: polysaccharide biosynthesis protein [Candidatus Nealsonbacteria bacterium RIFOXYD1_FULL_39_11]